MFRVLAGTRYNQLQILYIKSRVSLNQLASNVNHICFEEVFCCAFRVKLNNSLKKGHGKKSLKQGECHFMDGRERAPVALVSFPGSGNTWLRGLLEQATGICTGSYNSSRRMMIVGVY